MEFIQYSNKIAVFLNYKEYQKDSVFEYFLNDISVAKNKSPFYYFINLDCDTKYKVAIKRNGVLIDTHIISTLKSKKEIVVEVPNCLSIKETTKLIQSYLDRCNRNNILVFPKGTYKCGALFVKSNSTIYLNKDALILGSEDPNDYLPYIPSRFEGNEMMCYASLINIGKLNHSNLDDTTNNVYIFGEGEIRGGGENLCNNIIEKEIPHIDKSLCNDLSIGLACLAGRKRNRLINVSNGKNIVIDGLKLGFSASWNVHMIYSKDLYIHNCYFSSFGIHNGDGIDPDSCSNCYIFNNVFNVGDDCVAIKSGRNPDGNIINIPSNNINVFSCSTIKGHGCAIGSEVSGGIFDINIYDCDFTNTLYGIHIKTTAKRGGYINNININNCCCSSINIRCVPYNDDGVSANYLTDITNLTFKDINITGIMYLEKNKTDLTTHVQAKGFELDSYKFRNFIFENVTYFNYNKNIEYKKIINITNCVFNNEIFIEGGKKDEI